MNEEETVRADETDARDNAGQPEAGAGTAEEQEAENAEGQSGQEPGVVTEDEAMGSAQATGEESEEWRDKYLRLYAEFDNFRKRTMRERGDLVRSAGRELIEAMLPVLDDFERAAAAGEREDPERIKEGYTLIGQKMKGILEAKGLQRMEAKGAAFDTDLHEAITQIPAPSDEMKGKVVDVVEPGYKLHDSVLRFAKVVVGN